MAALEFLGGPYLKYRFLGPTQGSLNLNLEGSGLSLCAFERAPWIPGCAARTGITEAT